MKAEKYSTEYISLEDTRKQEVEFFLRSSLGYSNLKNLGFCGTDGLDKDGNSCTPVEDLLGIMIKI